MDLSLKHLTHSQVVEGEATAREGVVSHERGQIDRRRVPRWSHPRQVSTRLSWVDFGGSV